MKKVERFIVYGCVLAAIAVAVFFDWNISQALYKPDNMIGKALETACELPTYLMIVFAAILAAIHRPKPNPIWDKVFLLAFIVLAAVVAVYYGNRIYNLIVRNFGLELSKIISWGLRLGVAAVLLGVAFLIARTVRKERAREAFFFALFVIVLTGVVFLCTEMFKLMWLRPRYRTLMAMQEAGVIENAKDQWLAVYQPQFFTAFKNYQLGGELFQTQDQIDAVMKILGITKWENDEFTAFPSGHTSMAMLLLALSALPNLYPGLKEKTHFPLILRIVVYAFTLLVAFSRILVGAHHATDVLSAFLFVLVAFDFLYTFFYEGTLRKNFLEKPAKAPQISEQQQ